MLAHWRGKTKPNCIWECIECTNNSTPHQVSMCRQNRHTGDCAVHWILSIQLYVHRLFRHGGAKAWALYRSLPALTPTSHWSGQSQKGGTAITRPTTNHKTVLGAASARAANKMGCRPVVLEPTHPPFSNSFPQRVPVCRAMTDNKKGRSQEIFFLALSASWAIYLLVGSSKGLGRDWSGKAYKVTGTGLVSWSSLSETLWELMHSVKLCEHRISIACHDATSRLCMTNFLCIGKKTLAAGYYDGANVSKTLSQ